MPVSWLKADRARATVKLKAAQAARIEREDGPMFQGIPERWLEEFTVICSFGHVSTRVIKSEVYGDMCPECHGPCVMTAPETLGRAT